tara:strand:- start:2559 stop:3254 length:696 start_codon:yes stop_codon:yes gene_type:complete
MKNRTKYLLAALAIFTIVSCKPKSPYDTSTPEKMLSSLGQVSAQPKEQNPIPYFYVKKDAEAITGFDESGFKAIDAFEAFKTAMNTGFPTKITRLSKDKIEFNKDDSMFSTVSLSLSASLIRPQLQDRAPEDYEYVSATEPDENGVIKITCRMVDRETDLEVKKENGQYLMFLKDKDYIQIQKMTKFFEKAEALFTRAASEINKKEVTSENFGEMSSSWDEEYMNLFQELN